MYENLTLFEPVRRTGDVDDILNGFTPSKVAGALLRKNPTFNCFIPESIVREQVTESEYNVLKNITEGAFMTYFMKHRVSIGKIPVSPINASKAFTDIGFTCRVIPADDLPDTEFELDDHKCNGTPEAGLEFRNGSTKYNVPVMNGYPNPVYLKHDKYVTVPTQPAILSAAVQMATLSCFNKGQVESIKPDPSLKSFLGLDDILTPNHSVVLGTIQSYFAEINNTAYGTNFGKLVCHGESAAHAYYCLLYTLYSKEKYRRPLLETLHQLVRPKKTKTSWANIYANAQGVPVYAGNGISPPVQFNGEKFYVEKISVGEGVSKEEKMCLMCKNPAALLEVVTCSRTYRGENKGERGSLTRGAYSESGMHAGLVEKALLGADIRMFNGNKHLVFLTNSIGDIDAFFAAQYVEEYVGTIYVTWTESLEKSLVALHKLNSNGMPYKPDYLHQYKYGDAQFVVVLVKNLATLMNQKVSQEPKYTATEDHTLIQSGILFPPEDAFVIDFGKVYSGSENYYKVSTSIAQELEYRGKSHGGRDFCVRAPLVLGVKGMRTLGTSTPHNGIVYYARGKSPITCVNELTPPEDEKKMDEYNKKCAMYIGMGIMANYVRCNRPFLIAGLPVIFQAMGYAYPKLRLEGLGALKFRVVDRYNLTVDVHSLQYLEDVILREGKTNEEIMNEEAQEFAKKERAEREKNQVSAYPEEKRDEGVGRENVGGAKQEDVAPNFDAIELGKYKGY